MGPLTGGPQCHMLILRNGNVPCRYFCNFHVDFKIATCPLSNLRKGPCHVSNIYSHVDKRHVTCLALGANNAKDYLNLPNPLCAPGRPQAGIQACWNLLGAVLGVTSRCKHFELPIRRQLQVNYVQRVYEACEIR